MYVKKFEGDNLDETLQVIKRELGPDAIILKTVHNKGLKGAFAKNKVEITAAISEDNYSNKMKVDKVLNNEQKDEFYNSSSAQIKKHIENKSATGYGNLGLNRIVQKVADSTMQSLDDFLGNSREPEKVNVSTQSYERPQTGYKESMIEDSYPELESHGVQDMKIEALERKIEELSAQIERREEVDFPAIETMAQTLRGLEISEVFIRQVTKKARFELRPEELQDEEILFDLCLREMKSHICTGLPQFSSPDSKSSLTVLVSEGGSGQTTTLLKLASLVDNASLIQVQLDGKRDSHIAENFIGSKVLKTKSIPETVSAIRKGFENNQTVFVDFKIDEKNQGEAKKFLLGLKRSFENVEMLLTLNAIHDEVYNRKVVSKYKDLVAGLIFSHLDLTLNFGSIFNISFENSDKELKFFTTGEVVPNDIEAASPERILGELFHLS